MIGYSGSRRVVCFFLLLLSVRGFSQTPVLQKQVGHFDHIEGMQVVEKQNLLITHDYFKTILWELSSGRIIYNVNNAVLDFNVNKAAIDNESKYICLQTSRIDSAREKIFSRVNFYDLKDGEWINGTRLINEADTLPLKIHDFIFSGNGPEVFLVSETGSIVQYNFIADSIVTQWYTSANTAASVKRINPEEILVVVKEKSGGAIRLQRINTRRNTIVTDINLPFPASIVFASHPDDNNIVAMGGRNGKLVLLNIKTRKIVKQIFIDSSFCNILSMAFTSDHKNVVCFDGCSRKVFHVNIKTGTSELWNYSNDDDGVIEPMPWSKGIMVSAQNNFNLYDERSGELLKSYRTDNFMATQFQLSGKGEHILTDQSLLNLNKASYQSLGGTALISGRENECYIYDIDNGRIILKNIVSNDTLKIFTCDSSYDITKLAESPDGKWISAMDKERQTVWVWNGATAVLKHTFHLPGEQMKEMAFSADSRYLFIGTDTLYMFDAGSGERVHSFFQEKNNAVGDLFDYDPGTNVIAYRDKASRVSFYSFNTSTYVFTLHCSNENAASVVSKVKYDTRTNQWFILWSNGLLDVFDTTLKKVSQIQFPFNYTSDFSLDLHKGRIFVNTYFNGIHCYGYPVDSLPEELFNIQTFLTKGKNEFAFFVNDWYYAPKTTLNYLHLNMGLNTYPIDEYDFYFNNPSKILRALQSTDSLLINLYTAVYNKRISKSDEKPETIYARLMGKSNPDFRVTIINKREYPVITSKPAVDLKVHFYAFSDPTKSRFSINKVSVKDIGSKSYKQKGSLKYTSTYLFKISMKLNEGNNRVRIRIGNDEEMSLTESFEIVYKPAKPVQKKIRFIGIGVSDYKDSTMNLRYAAKDIRDLAAQYAANARSSGQSITIDTFINAAATKENILEVREKLMKAGIDDQVIVAVSGHGLLNDSLDFYYATYDCDFSKPETRGLRYDDLEHLLTGIPARNRLLLIDACHSGEVDKETRVVKKAGNDTIREYVTKGSELLVDSNDIGMENMFELMRFIFDDYSQTSGVQVISAAGGMEYALESARWNNGVFTYCVLNAMKNGAADLNGDKKTSVEELKNYVSTQVQHLTGGKQKPTSRRENLENDWGLW